MIAFLALLSFLNAMQYLLWAVSTISFLQDVEKRSISKLRKLGKNIQIAYVNMNMIQKLNFVTDPRFSCKLG